MRSRLPATFGTALAAAALLVPSTARAQAAQPPAGSSASVHVNIQGPGSCGANDPLGHLASVSCPWGTTPNGLPIFGAAAASVDAEGKLHAAVDLHCGLFNPTGVTDCAGDAIAARWDRLSFEGDVLPAAVRVSVALHGRAGGAGTDPGARLSFALAGIEGSYDLDSQQADGQTHWRRATWTIPLGETAAFAYSLSLYAHALIYSGTGGAGGGIGPGVCEDLGPAGLECRAETFADFGNTAFIEALEGLDGDGNAIASGLRLCAASGKAYALAGGVNVGVTTTPEPAAAWLLGAGAASLAVVRRRRRAAA